jgi:hypothetical protein
VNVFFAIGIPVVIPMLRRPPKHSLLRRTLREECHEKLGNAPETVASVAEVPMVSSGDTEHPYRVGCQEPEQKARSGGKEEHSHHSQMQDHKQQYSSELVVVRCLGAFAHIRRLRRLSRHCQAFVMDKSLTRT